MAEDQEQVIPARTVAREAREAGWNILAIQVDSSVTPSGNPAAKHYGDAGYDTEFKYKVSPSDGLAAAIQLVESEGWHLDKVMQTEVAAPSVKVLCIFRRTGN